MTYSDWSGHEQEDGELDALRRERRTLEERVEAVEQRLATLTAQLEALDASYVRSQGQREHDLDRADRMIERVRQELDHHLNAHWRQR